MKVLVLHNAYQSHFYGGEDVVVSREVASLKEILGEKNVYEYKVSNDDIHPLRLAFTIWGDKGHFAKIKHIVQQNQIDIAHVHNFFPLLTPAVFAAAKQGGAKVIQSLHNFRWWCLSGILYRENKGICEECIEKKSPLPAVKHGCYRHSKSQSLIGSLAFSWYRHTAVQDNIDAYFALSLFQQEKIKSLLPRDKIFLKPNAIDEPTFIQNVALKKNYLFVGRLEEAKGISFLLQVWEKLPLDFYLEIIGDGPLMQQLQKRYLASNISFLGQLPHQQVCQKMANAKYLIHPSLTYETFGLTMVEALARGTPVIGLKRGTRVEFVQSGKNGFLCELENLLETIRDAHQYPRYDDLSHHAMLSVKRYYAKAVIEKQVRLYQTILDKVVS